MTAGEHERKGRSGQSARVGGRARRQLKVTREEFKSMATLEERWGAEGDEGEAGDDRWN